MIMSLFQKGWNYSQDGPGNRLIYHLQGCNFKCPWCCNPEGCAIDGEMIVNTNKLLQGLCPEGNLKNEKLNRQTCLNCEHRICIGKNRNTGIRFSMEKYDIQSLLSEINQVKDFFFDGGGITLSGGEPTLQFDQCLYLLKELRKSGINTAIETNGSHPRLKELFPYLNHVIIDWKHWDPDTHFSRVKYSNEMVLRNIEASRNAESNTLIRVTLIPGFNDGLNNIREFIKTIKRMKMTKYCSIELLSYHEYARPKWQSIDQNYSMESVFIKDADKKEYLQMFEKEGICTIKT
jgi:pyruvate formate lyase activating enzyme